MNLLFIETNTGGPDPGVHSVLQVGIGAIVQGGARVIESFLVREPDIRIDPRSARIHGITAYACERSGIDPRAAARRILDFMSAHLERDGAALCGWNVGIDRAFLARMFRLAGEGDWLLRFERALGFRSLDLPSALRFMAAQGLAPAFHDFADACEKLGVLNERPHDAESDVRACTDLLDEMRALMPRGGSIATIPATLSTIEAAEAEGTVGLEFSVTSKDAMRAIPLLGRALTLAIHEGSEDESTG